ncbi:hypothetical protein MUY27_11205 [Mucilaginibacter sp. RS28]|uniref:Uncharacterized protein n=1 Tax=Mucilaginibacter straminoryzae TaxID=2932774 RepID=A0A9X1X473_9SPHI|nr:hypothetical protein [Mucilaginibacter straminoryzae]MCJ8210276.1 hypothetical protein [Mucilaginibacter straminoryzae]
MEKIASGYTSVGAITEQVHFFIAPYSQQHRISKGGGLEEEGEAVET